MKLKKFTEETANLLAMTMIQRGLNPRKISYTLKMDIRDITHALTRNTNRGVTVEKLLKIAKHLGLENPELEDRGPVTKYSKKKAEEPLEAPAKTSFPAANDEFWTTKDGRKIPIAEMDEEHVRNTLRLLIRKKREFESGIIHIRHHQSAMGDMAQMELEHMWEQEMIERDVDDHNHLGLGADDIMSF